LIERYGYTDGSEDAALDFEEALRGERASQG
jgi:hypothetical protein